MITQLKVNIRKVDAERIRPLRHSELRKGQDFSTTSYLKDYEINTFHMACIVDDKPVTCATFYPEKSTKIKTENAYRLRGMATDSRFKRKGYASNLMAESFKELKKRDCNMVWCNARLVAVDFYKSVGFKITGELFDIKGIGPHYYMYKEI
ncbi:MAG: GNAT family N-acetyltransferase [Flavobacteriales bacterium]|jgi:predicted GNAT family N-acyltransferase|nr:GNAT family N-acetyltransferase [Flavobacteriales bacterium]